jgi:hypothetical protein
VANHDNRPSDPIVARAVDALRALPLVERGAIARTVAEAARLRTGDLAPNEDDLVPELPVRHWSSRAIAIAAAAAVAVAIGAGVLVRTQSISVARIHISPEAHARSPLSATPVVPAVAGADAIESAAIPTQFVYDGPAHRVTLVGDFNGWDDRATPLLREPGSALWSVTVPLSRGRHVYAFIVDSTWTTDRRAPVSRDPDFGVEGSVIIVGRP